MFAAKFISWTIENKEVSATNNFELEVKKAEISPTYKSVAKRLTI